MDQKTFVPNDLYSIDEDEYIIDSFCGGGGASKGIEMAISRSPDIAINHDKSALSMHRINHPTTRHLRNDIWAADPVAETAGKPIGLLWASPDCRNHSKARGGPVTSKRSRDLAWVVVRWAGAVAPRIIVLENVEEFKDWADLDPDGYPVEAKKGETFAKFVQALQQLGYEVQWRLMRACDFGAPTIRKRLFLIARRDGGRVTWPEPTHGDPKDLRVQAGALKPYRTAAECIDWSIPCPSIFLSKEDARKVGANRPLAPATMARTAKGVQRYVLDNAKPFLVSLTHQGKDRIRPIDEPTATVTAAHRGETALIAPTIAAYYGEGSGGNNRSSSIEDPLHTVVTENRNALITPFLTKFRTGAVGGDLDDPMPTVTANSFSKRPGCATPLGIIAPVIAHAQQGGRVRDANAPLHTITASDKDQNQVIATTLRRVKDGDIAAPFVIGTAHGEGQGRGKSEWPLEEPLRTITASRDHAVIAPYLVPRYGERQSQEPRTRSVEQPAATIVTTANGDGLATATIVPAATLLQSQYGKSVGGPIDAPAATITAGGGGKQALVAAFLGQQNTGLVGHAATEPLSTIVAKGCTQTVMAAHLTHLYSSNTAGGQGNVQVPLKTITAGGGHAALVGAFLQKYYSSGQPSQTIDEPLHTVTSKGRFGLVTVDIHGEPYVIVDIGMRMLQPKELFAAQGFPPTYIFEWGIDENGEKIKLTKTEQIRMCGNSVVPNCAKAIIAAQFPTTANAVRIKLAA
jgi:DNA (cytosine-5)-methyltransferase 1